MDTTPCLVQETHLELRLFNWDKQEGEDGLHIHFLICFYSNSIVMGALFWNVGRQVGGDAVFATATGHFVLCIIPKRTIEHKRNESVLF